MRGYNEMIQDALHQRRVNEHAEKPNELFDVTEPEYRTICMAEFNDPFVSKRSQLTSAPEEFCGLRIQRRTS